MTTLPTPRRKPIPDRVKVQVLLRMLGLKDRPINWSHEPALESRAINDEGTDWKPPQHDDEHIYARTKEEHDHITFKDNGTGRGDLATIAKGKRIRRKEAEHRAARMLTAIAQEIGSRDLARRGKRKITSHGFSKQHRPMQSKSTFQRSRT